MDSSDSCLNIVLIEDHDVLRELLQQALEEVGHHVVALSSAEELEDEPGSQAVDVFLVDLNLPGEDGLSLSGRLRKAYPLAGLIILTARSALADKLAGYASGADVYLTKPIDVPELCAAVAAFARRRQSLGKLMAEQAALVLCQQSMTVGRTGGVFVKLSADESAMLAMFSRAPGHRVAYWQIAETLSLDVQTYSKSSLEVRIVRLRKKLIAAGALAECIKAVRGYGYQLCIDLQII